MKIVLVDDSKAVRIKLRNIVESLGHEVVGEAEHGGEVLGLYELYRPDLVTLDVVMPEMGGMEALRELKRRAPNANVVMVTSAATVRNMMEAQELGARYFIMKPFRKEQVEGVVTKIASEINLLKVA